jgi:hypothetical protein
MARATITRTSTGMPDSDVAALRLEFNKLCADLDTVQAKVNEIIAEAATNIAAVAALDDVEAETASLIAGSTGSTTV